MGFKLNKDDVDMLNSLSRVTNNINFGLGYDVGVMNALQTNYATCKLSNAVQEEFFLIDIRVLLKNLKVYENYEEYELEYDPKTERLRISAVGMNDMGNVKTYIETSNPKALKFNVPIAGLRLPESPNDIVFSLNGNNIETAMKLKGVNRTDIISIVKRSENTHITIEGVMRNEIDGNRARGSANEESNFIDPTWSIELQEYDGETFAYYFDDKFFRLHNGDYEARIIQYTGTPEVFGRSSIGNSEQITSMGLISKEPVEKAVNYIIGYHAFSRNQKGMR